MSIPAELLQQEVIGGLIATCIALYGIHRKFKADGVENANQKAEIDIIGSLNKQRDDAILLSDKYRDALLKAEELIREIRELLYQKELENIKLIEKIDMYEAEIETLKELINYLTDTVSVARQSIESNIDK